MVLPCGELHADRGCPPGMFSGRTAPEPHRPRQNRLRTARPAQLAVLAFFKPDGSSGASQRPSSRASAPSPRSGLQSGVFKQGVKGSFAFTVGLNAAGGGGPGAGGDGKGYGGGGGGDGSAFSYGAEGSANVLADLSLSDANEMVEEVIILDVSGQQRASAAVAGGCTTCHMPFLQPRPASAPDPR
jgi:hypothetical protein